jgi:hypothetical protein
MLRFNLALSLLLWEDYRQSSVWIERYHDEKGNRDPSVFVGG